MKIEPEEMEKDLWWGYKVALEVLKEHLPEALEKAKKQSDYGGRMILSPEADSRRICRAVRDMMLVEGIHEGLLYIRATTRL